MKRRLSAACLLLTLLCGACAAGASRLGPPPEGQYSLYFLTTEGREDDAALGWEFRSPPEGGETVEGLMALLLAGPESDALASPFPQGTAVRTCGVEEGVACVDLSEAYEGLSGAGLTLADGCVVLTLCQLEGVESVYLTVEGHPRPFRDQVFSPADFMLDNASAEELGEKE